MNIDNFPHGKIYVVDDELANLKLIHRVLNRIPELELYMFQDPTAVAPHYEKIKPDLILLDLNMPKMSGYDVMEKLNELEDPIKPPIVILTAQSSSDYLLKALHMGARDYLTKPFDRNELIMRVRNLLDAHLAHRMVYDQKNVLEDMVAARTEELRKTQLQVVQRLGMAAEYRDEETGDHILRMSHMCRILAEGVGWNKQQAEMLLHASPMHDIGKIGIPDRVLLKPGKLTPDEWKIMQTHTTIGKKLLDQDTSPLMKMACEVAYAHHEKWDGSGYPQQIGGEEIPISGRIAALADVFDALTSERPYKKAWSLEDSLNLIKENRGKHFDPNLVDLFMEKLPEIIEVKNRFSSDSETIQVVSNF